MKKPLGISAGIHVAALLALIIGLPTFVQEVEMSQQIIPVDIVNVADVTNTKVSDQPTPNPTPAPTKTEEPKPQPTPEDKAKEVEPPKEQPKEAPKEDAEIIPDKTKPVEKPKEEKPKPPEPKKPDTKKDEPQKSLASVLKNIEKLKDTAKPSPTPNPNAPDDKTPVTSNSAPSLGQTLSISEMDALRRQIQQCWSVPVGGRGVDNMVVELYIEVNDDRTVRRVEVVDSGRMLTDQYFRAMGESAVRAIKNPRCSPLMLPPDKMDQWGKIRMMFNPKDML